MLCMCHDRIVHVFCCGKVCFLFHFRRSSTNELKLPVCRFCAASEGTFASFADATYGFLMNFVSCSSACSCAGGNELPIFFTKFAFQLSADAASQHITRPLLLKSSILCAEVRQLLQRTLKHAQSSGSIAACRASLEKFGSVLRSISCSVSHLLLQIIVHTDDSVHGSCASAPLLHQLLLLAQFLQVCLDLPSVAGSYSSHLSFSPPPLIASFLSRDTTPAMTLPQKFSSMLFKRCENNLQRYYGTLRRLLQSDPSAGRSSRAPIIPTHSTCVSQPLKFCSFFPLPMSRYFPDFKRVPW
jgi:hypothetical protein